MPMRGREMPYRKELVRARCPERAGPHALICLNLRSSTLGTIGADAADMELGLGGGQATLSMLGALSTLQHRVFKFLTRGPARVTLGSTAGRHRVAFADAILLVCVFVFGGLIVLGSVMMLLSLVTAALPPSRPQVDVYPAPADGNDLWVDDPRTGQSSMMP